MLRIAALVLLTATASAQPAADCLCSESRAPTVLEGVAIYATGATVAVVSVAGGLQLTQVINGDTARLLTPVIATVGVTAATYGMGRLLGADGTLRGAAAGAALGAVPGTVLFAVSLTDAGYGGFLPLLAGLYSTVALIPAGALAGYVISARRAVTVAPAALAAPTGEGGVGLRLTIGL